MYSKKYDSTAEKATVAEKKTNYTESKNNVTALDFSSAPNTSDTEAADEPITPKDNVVVFTPQDDRPKPKLHETAGIIYEVAEMLYLKETEAAKVKEEPPFRKELSEEDIKAIEENAQKQKSELETVVQEAAVSPEIPTVKTSGAFGFLLVLCIPLVNLFVDIVLIGRKKTNPNYRAFAKANLIWSLILVGIIGLGIALMMAFGIELTWNTVKM